MALGRCPRDRSQPLPRRMSDQWIDPARCSRCPHRPARREASDAGMEFGELPALPRAEWWLPRLEVALGHVWRAARRRRCLGVAGDDGVHLCQFCEERPERLATLAEALALGAYHRGSFREYQEMKLDGSTRTIRIPTAGDRVLARAVLTWLTPRVPLCESAIGGRPGGRPEDALFRIKEAAAQRRPFIFRGDIERFFDRVPRSRVFAQLRSAVGASTMCGLAEELTLPPASQPEGLVQGVSLSPLLANLYLTPLDLRFEGRPYVRFVDDIAVACGSRSAASRSRRQARDVVEGLGLDLKEADEKTAVRRVDEDPVPTFLRVELREGHLRVPLTRLRAMMAAIGEAESLLPTRCYDSAKLLRSTESAATYFGFCHDPSIATVRRRLRQVKRLLPCADGVTKCIADGFQDESA